MRTLPAWLLVITLGLCFALSCVSSARCTADQFAVFRDATIAGPVNKCKSASEVNLMLPPTTPLSESDRTQICEERTCKDMIAAIDDMEVPRCELVVKDKNVTLQVVLDQFTGICDGPRKPVPPKKHTTPKKAAANSAPASSPLAGMVATLAVVAFSLVVSW